MLLFFQQPLIQLFHAFYTSQISTFADQKISTKKVEEETKVSDKKATKNQLPVIPQTFLSYSTTLGLIMTDIFSFLESVGIVVTYLEQCGKSQFWALAGQCIAYSETTTTFACSEFSPSTPWANVMSVNLKLKFLPVKPFQPILLFVGKARSLPQSKGAETFFNKVCFCITNKHWNRLERHAGEEHSSLLRTFVNYGYKKFFINGPRAQ